MERGKNQGKGVVVVIVPGCSCLNRLVVLREIVGRRSFRVLVLP